jgi:signal transduction histidine kinase
LELKVEPGFECFTAKARLQLPDENEWTVIRKDGSRLPVMLSITAMRESSGEISGYLGILRDISARKATSVEMARLNRELMAASRTAGMAEVATGVLHNVGNVLNSVNVSLGVIHAKLDESRVGRLGDVCDLMAANRGNLGDYLARDPKGSNLPEYLRTLATRLQKERDDIKAEASTVLTRVEHIKQIVASQQSFSRQGGATESLSPAALFDEALKIQEGAFQRHHVQVVRENLTTKWVFADRHRALQIIINLLANAKAAMANMPLEDRRLILRLEAGDQDRVCFSVIDSGSGISRENLAKIFQHGFTTKKEGHGFGLHSCANAAAEMKGALRVHSDGPGTGATFTLELPSAPAPGGTTVLQKRSTEESLSKLSLP